MGKRKTDDYAMGDDEPTNQHDSDGMEDNPSDVDVDFEFFDPKEIDFYNIKNFMNNLFGKDRIDSSDLSNLIIEQPLIGTTIKTEGEDDALAIFTVLNMNTHSGRSSISQIREYITNSSQSSPKLIELLNQTLNPNSECHIGLILNERLINMPVQVAPPMYRMLEEELSWAIEENEPYKFEYYLLISKTYQEVEAQETGEGGRDDQIKKKGRNQPSVGTFFINLEDDLISKFAEFELDLPFQESAVPDAKRAFSEFGVLPGRRLFVIHHSKYKPILSALTEAIPPQ